jgi:hypothetical protein
MTVTGGEANSYPRTLIVYIMLPSVENRCCFRLFFAIFKMHMVLQLLCNFSILFPTLPLLNFIIN